MSPVDGLRACYEADSRAIAELQQHRRRVVASLVALGRMDIACELLGRSRRTVYRYLSQVPQVCGDCGGSYEDAHRCTR